MLAIGERSPSAFWAVVRAQGQKPTMRLWSGSSPAFANNVHSVPVLLDAVTDDYRKRARLRRQDG
jgi:hypothetical protein